VWMGVLFSWKTSSSFQEKCLDHEMCLITQPVHILPCSISAKKDNNGTIRILYHNTGCGLNHLTENALQCIVALMVFTK
jgi:hypothetical protein